MLYCIGEKSEEQEAWQQVLGDQLAIGLDGTDKSRVVIAYEPIWSIGPGKTPADKPYIEKIARFVKERTGGLDVVYGGGLKADNAAMLASIADIDGGLIGPDPVQRRDRLLPRGVSGNHPPVSGPLRTEVNYETGI